VDVGEGRGWERADAALVVQQGKMLRRRLRRGKGKVEVWLESEIGKKEEGRKRSKER
jgi:hypothetical protein